MSWRDALTWNGMLLWSDMRCYEITICWDVIWCCGMTCYDPFRYVVMIVCELRWCYDVIDYVMMMWYDRVWYGGWYDMIWSATICCDDTMWNFMMLWYDKVWYDVMVWYIVTRHGVLWWCLVTRCDKIWYVMTEVEGFQNYTGQGVPQDGRRGGRGARKKQNLHQRVRKKKGGGKGKENSCRRLSNIVECCGIFLNVEAYWLHVVAYCLLALAP